MFGEANLEGQVGLVTGGGRGIGRAIAQGLAKAEMAVTVMSRSRTELGETVALIREAGGRAIALPGDVTDQRAVWEVVTQTIRRLGPIDLLVNNAGTALAMGPIAETDPDVWWRDFEINLRGPFLCSNAVLPGMIERKRGRIINVASYAGIRPYPNLSAYACSKAALLRLTDTLAAEVKDYGIGVFAVTPGWTHTAMAEHLVHSPEGSRYFDTADRTPEEKWRQPEQLVDLVTFFAGGFGDSLAGRFVNLADDVHELVRRADEIEREDLYALRLRK